MLVDDMLVFGNIVIAISPNGTIFSNGKNNISTSKIVESILLCDIDNDNVYIVQELQLPNEKVLVQSVISSYGEVIKSQSVPYEKYITVGHDYIIVKDKNDDAVILNSRDIVVMNSKPITLDITGSNPIIINDRTASLIHGKEELQDILHQNYKIIDHLTNNNLNFLAKNGFVPLPQLKPQFGHSNIFALNTDDLSYTVILKSTEGSDLFGNSFCLMVVDPITKTTRAVENRINNIWSAGYLDIYETDKFIMIFVGCSPDDLTGITFIFSKVDYKMSSFDIRYSNIFPTRINNGVPELDVGLYTIRGNNVYKRGDATPIMTNCNDISEYAGHVLCVNNSISNSVKSIIITKDGKNHLNVNRVNQDTNTFFDNENKNWLISPDGKFIEHNITKSIKVGSKELVYVDTTIDRKNLSIFNSKGEKLDRCFNIDFYKNNKEYILIEDDIYHFNRDREFDEFVNSCIIGNYGLMVSNLKERNFVLYYQDRNGQFNFIIRKGVLIDE